MENIHDYINRQIVFLEKEIDKDYSEMNHLKSLCLHPAPNVKKTQIKKTKEDSLEPDQCWIECYCACCHKTWTLI